MAVLPFFVSAFVHALAWSALADPKVGIVNLVLAAMGVLLVVDISTIGGVALVQELCHIPFVFLFVSAALSAVDPSLEEAARTSGAGVWRTVQRVTLPIVTPALLSAGVLVFALMAGNFAIHHCWECRRTWNSSPPTSTGGCSLASGAGTGSRSRHGV